MFPSSGGVTKIVSRVELEIRPFRNADGPRVRELFIEVNRLLSPPDLRDATASARERVSAIDCAIACLTTSMAMFKLFYSPRSCCVKGTRLQVVR